MPASRSGRIGPWTRNRRCVPAMLAGAWRADNDQDRQVLADLAAMPYEAIEEAARRPGGPVDAPVRKIGQLWRLTSLRDAWILLAPRLTEGQVERLTTPHSSPCSASPILASPSARMDRWLRGPEQLPTRPSEDLRRGTD